MSCTRPFYEYLSASGGSIWDFLLCPYAIGGLMFTGVGLFVVVTGFVGLKNQTESWTAPVLWLAIVTPAMAATLLPGVLLRRVAGIVTLAVAGVLIGLYWWWGRA